MPKGRDPNGYPELVGTALLQFNQGQIRLGFNPALDRSIMLGQTGTPVAANLFGQTLPRSAMFIPKSLDTLAADAKAFRDFPGAFAAFPCSNNPLSQILA